MLLIEAIIRISAVTLLMTIALVAVRDVRPARSWPYVLDWGAMQTSDLSGRL